MHISCRSPSTPQVPAISRYRVRRPRAEFGIWSSTTHICLQGICCWSSSIRTRSGRSVSVLERQEGRGGERKQTDRQTLERVV